MLVTIVIITTVFDVQIKSLWLSMSIKKKQFHDMEPEQNSMSPPQISFATVNEKQVSNHQTPHDNSLSSLEAYSFLSIKTPEMVSTPLSDAALHVDSSPSLSVNDNNISAMETEIQKSNGGSFLSSGECISRCELDSSRELDDDGDDDDDDNQSETSQLPLFDLDDKNNTSNFHDSSSSPRIDNHQDTISDSFTSDHVESHDVSHHGDEIEEVVWNGVELKKSQDSYVIVSDSSDDDDSDDKLGKCMVL